MRRFLYILPVALIFSYYPVIHFGADKTMNFEISLSLIWLVLFDVFALILILTNKKIKNLWQFVVRKWFLFLFPIFVSLSLFWTMNLIRGILTVGILWLIYFAVLTIWWWRKELLKDKKFKINFLKWFFGATLFVCVWCLLQCIFDIAGASTDASLMCAGCVTKMFGFPHPNGFAIEPQFMGNLLLAPTITAGWLCLKKQDNISGSDFSYSKLLLCCFFVFTCTLFLTFSRGAIYAFIVAMIFFTVLEIVRTKKWRTMLLWPVIILAFIFTLNLQGIFAQVSNTNDTYFDGVAKVLNHLSLGKIDLSGQKENNNLNENGEENKISEGNENEKKSENEEAINKITMEDNSAVFDGYVEESTNIRMDLTKSAIKLWKENPKNILVGVGIGGAGRVLYNAGLVGSPKEIIQNEYVSLLLETGFVGVILAIIVIVILVKYLVKNSASAMILTLLVAYAVSLLFFSGFANALQIYLMPVALLVVLAQSSLRKKLVS